MKTTIHRTLLAAAACALLYAAAVPAHATSESTDGQGTKSPTEIIKAATQDVLDILRNPDLQGEEHREKRRQMLRDAVSHMFDWEAMARSSLAQHWRDRTDAEKKEFTGLFRKLLEETYLKRIRRNTDADLQYVEEEIDGDYATVKTVAVTRDGTKVPIQYRLQKVGQEKRKENPKLPAWQVYDVSVEGVSLVNNYRAQFRDILIGRSYDQLVEMLRKKVEKDE